jgi:hypothetical protein
MPDPEWSFDPSSIYTDGRRTAATPYHHNQEGTVTTVLSQVMGVDSEGQPAPADVVKGGLATVDAGYSPANETLIYYITDSDSSTYPGKFVVGSTGKPKKLVTFPSGAVSGDLVQVTIFLYQAPTFPSKVTHIYTYEEDVVFYLDNGSPKYDYSSSAQNNTSPN